MVEVIEDEVFSSKALGRLTHLNLSNNKLKILPPSMVELPELRELNLANNVLQILPYNIHRLVSLCVLKLNGNRLQALPSPIALLRLTQADISVNCLHLPNSVTGLRHYVQLKNEPTLFELAGAVLTTHLSRQTTRLQLPDTEEVPKMLIDYMKNAKYCRYCGKTVFRYTMTFQADDSSFAHELVKSSRDYNVCTVRCDKCTLSWYGRDIG